MSYHQRRKIFLLLTILLIILAAVFLVALLHPSTVFFNIGLPNILQNYFILFFSFLCICLIVWDLKHL
ncbi:hypothetical protein HYV86_07230 [Candidatus Woesearchaeota archaeon]|nr:hypothetical protein [Candidatus Woesearchaeota archaeon]